MLTVGEVRTGLLHHSTPLPAKLAGEVLTFTQGEPVRSSDRPTAYAVSPSLITGVDCVLPGGPGAPRVVGTVLSRAVLHGGHVLQGSARVRAVRGDGRIRRWSDHLTRPGEVQTAADPDWRDVAGAIAARVPGPSTLDLGTISESITALVNGSAELDRRPPLLVAPRTRVRWLLRRGAGRVSVHFRVESPVLRTVVVRTPDPAEEAVAELCEDLALHDWLLTTLLGLIERSGIGARRRAETIERLGVAVDFLLHLWMPAARIHGPLADVWQALERQPGFTRQWEVSVRRIRDQLAMGAATRGE